MVVVFAGKKTKKSRVEIQSSSISTFIHMSSHVFDVFVILFIIHFLTSGLFIYPVGEYIKLYHLLLPFKDTMNKPGRPNKELSMIRKEATDAWEELVKTNVDVSDLPKPFWTFKKVCSSAYD